MRLLACAPQRAYCGCAVQRCGMPSACEARQQSAFRYRHDDLHRDVGAGGRASGRSISARDFPTPRARRTWCGPPPTRCWTAATSIRRCPACRSCVRRSPPPIGASMAWRWIWASEVVVTSGATEAITACLMAVLNPGDEVVLIEPLYDTYCRWCACSAALPRLVRLEPPDWALPRAALADAFSPSHQGDPAQFADEPVRQGVHRARSWRSSPSLCCATTPMRSATRSMST